MKLTNENYFSVESNQEYMSASSFKDFMKCEVDALKKVNGEVVEEPSKAMLVGSYVDAYFSGEMDDFKKKNPQIFKKDGTLLKDFEQANDIIKAIESDSFFMDYMRGEKQKIMTGIIAGVKFKIKIDCLLKNIIVDQKVMASIREPIWVERDGRNVKTDFVDAFGYDIQGAIYQEIVRQNTGILMPFVLAVATKEENPDKAIIQIDQYWLDRALKVVEGLAPRFDAIKKGIVEPQGCGRCPSCRKDLILDSVVSYEQLFHKVREEENED